MTEERFLPTEDICSDAFNDMKVRDLADLLGFTPRHLARLLLRQATSRQLIEEAVGWEIPWTEENVSALAQRTKTLRVYFMSSEGLVLRDANQKDYDGKAWGDSSLIVFPNGATMLVDVGRKPYGHYLVHNLERLGVSRLDYLVLTHPHDDHCFGLLDSVNVLDSFPIGQVLFTGTYNSKWDDLQLIEHLCEARRIPYSTFVAGDCFEVGEVCLKAFSPDRSVVGTTAERVKDAVNRLSMVFKLTYRQRSILMAGDTNCYEEAHFVPLYENELKSDVLKIAHHCAPNSTTQGFIDAVRPSVCYGMGWKEMNPETYARFKRIGTTVFMDVFDGFLEVTTDGVKLETRTSRVRQECIDRYYELACRGL